MTAGQGAFRVWFAVLAVITLGNFASCSRETARRPPSPKIGTDVCAACTMPLSDSKTVGACLIERSGGVEYLFYDDLGCMLDADREKHDFQTLERWVADFRQSGWIEAESAAYAYSPSIRTPMSSGIVALSNRAEIAKLGVDCRAFSWPEVCAERKNSMESRFGKPPA